jgi:hypothetical protein
LNSCGFCRPIRWIGRQDCRPNHRLDGFLTPSSLSHAKDVRLCTRVGGRRCNAHLRISRLARGALLRSRQALGFQRSRRRLLPSHNGVYAQCVLRVWSWRSGFLLSQDYQEQLNASHLTRQWSRQRATLRLAFEMATTFRMQFTRSPACCSSSLTR